MAFETPKERYASFGIVSNIPGQLVDNIWKVIDQYLIGLYPLDTLLTCHILKKEKNLSLEFTFSRPRISIVFDLTIPFNPFYPHKILILEGKNSQTILLPEEIDLF
ncbi:DUF960 family protein [Streptococcus sp. DD13]|uniref:DUF960 family protein n=1 Tax=Streptococcus sp. DD13 TaxID=1777881 RepID=UPI0007995730|nr:DUF960 family protein [Streptococcus sp. DD13]KXT79344.1 hypothetical protein STRDD13_00001 [Streptococcus sp. DD13]